MKKLLIMSLLMSLFTQNLVNARSKKNNQEKLNREKLNNNKAPLVVAENNKVLKSTEFVDDINEAQDTIRVETAPESEIPVSAAPVATSAPVEAAPEKDKVFSMATLNKILPIVQNTKGLVSTSIDLESWFKDNVIEGPKSVRIVGENGKDVVSGPNNENIGALVRSLSLLTANLLEHLLGQTDLKIVDGKMPINGGVLYNAIATLQSVMKLINGLNLPVNKASTAMQNGSAKAEAVLNNLQSMLQKVIVNMTEALSIADIVVKIIAPDKTSTVTPMVIEISVEDFKDAGIESVSSEELDDILADLDNLE